MCGERISFNCSTLSYQSTNILEIGQNNVIEQRIRRNEPVSGNVTYGYVPEGCNVAINNQTCSKIMNVTVTADMYGKSYQCVSYRRGVLLPKKHYSLGGFITGSSELHKNMPNVFIFLLIVKDSDICTANKIARKLHVIWLVSQFL